MSSEARHKTSCLGTTCTAHEHLPCATRLHMHGISWMFLFNWAASLNCPSECTFNQGSACACMQQGSYWQVRMPLHSRAHACTTQQRECITLMPLRVYAAQSPRCIAHWRHPSVTCFPHRLIAQHAPQARNAARRGELNASVTHCMAHILSCHRALAIHGSWNHMHGYKR
jgi:hypothetical protein